jgi:hypothetical protein
LAPFPGAYAFGIWATNGSLQSSVTKYRMIRIASRASGGAPFDSFVIVSISTVRRPPGDLAPCIRHLYPLLGRQRIDHRINALEK